MSAANVILSRRSTAKKELVLTKEEILRRLPACLPIGFLSNLRFLTWLIARLDRSQVRDFLLRLQAGMLMMWYAALAGRRIALLRMTNFGVR